MKQGIFVLDPNGKIKRRIGESGEGPGQFRRLADVMVDSKGQIWSTDYLVPRISVFRTNGLLLRTFLLPRILYARNMWLDEGSDKLYISGCINSKTNDTLSPCRLLHVVDANTGAHLGSFVDADPSGREQGLYRYVIDSMSRSSDGTFWIAEEAFLKVYRYESKSNAVRAIGLTSTVAQPPRAFAARVSRAQVEEAFKQASRIDGIFCDKESVIVSVNIPNRGTHVMEVLDRDGRQTGLDIGLPGRPIGVVDGELYLVRQANGRAEVLRTSVLTKD